MSGDVPREASTSDSHSHELLLHHNHHDNVCKRCEKLFSINDGDIFAHLLDFAALRASSLTCACCNVLFESVIDSAEDEAIFTGSLDDAETSGCIVRVYKDYHVFQLSLRVPLRHDSGRVEIVRFDGKAISYCFSEASCFEQPLWSCTSGDASTLDRVPVIKEWVSQCDKSHPECRSSQTALPTLPTRVLDVSCHDGDDDLRLMHSNADKGLYAALSHCWGSSQPLITTKNSLAQRLDRIRLQDLPRTFCDAVEVVRALGLQYLWIDSLCILQDDEGDWQRESAKMAEVFQNAYITLSATAAEDSSGGLNSGFYPPLHVHHVSGKRASFRISQSKGLSPIRHAPLSQRAWVLQETLLSRRVVHFTQAQWYWECAWGFLSENALSQIPREDQPSQWDDRLAVFMHKQQHHKFDRNHALEMWWETLCSYTELSLTKPSDKIAALSGLIRFFEHLFQEESFLGVWKFNPHEHLLWIIVDFEATFVDQSLNLPSWSPLRVNGCITSLNGTTLNAVKDVKIMQVLETEVIWSGTRLTSPISSSTLILRSRAIVPHSIIYPEPPSRPSDTRYGSMKIALGKDKLAAAVDLDTFLDDAGIAAVGNDMLAFEVDRRQFSPRESQWSFYLLLLRVVGFAGAGYKEEYYQRIGVGEFKWGGMDGDGKIIHNPFEDAEWKTVSLR